MGFIINVVSQGKQRRPRLVFANGLTAKQCTSGFTGNDQLATTKGEVAQKVALAKAFKRNNRLRKRERVTAYMAAEHDYQLQRGDCPFGKPQRMTGQAAYDTNRQLEKKFFDDKSPNARLWRWYLVERSGVSTA